MLNNNEVLAKIVLLGDDRAGKSQLSKRFCENAFSEAYTSTIGAEFKTKRLNVIDRTAKVLVWDISGQGKYKPLTNLYMTGVSGALILFPVNQPDSLTRAEHYLKQVRRECPPGTFILLVGTKSDLRNNRNVNSRMVSQDEAEAFAMRHGIQYIETSAKDGTRVQEPFDLIARDVVNRPIEEQQQQARPVHGSVSTCSIF